MFSFLKKNKSQDMVGSNKIKYLVVGLGNPGPKYAKTRHNVGFMAVDSIVEKLGKAEFKSKKQALICDITLEKTRVLFVKPQTFMNLSGEAVGYFAKFYKVPVQNIIVVFDDVALPFGKIRIRKDGSAGGHNGVKSIIYHLGGQNFPRVKIGVGPKPQNFDLADFVLSKISTQEENELETSITNADEAIKLLVNGDYDKACNLYNK